MGKGKKEGTESIRGTGGQRNRDRLYTTEDFLNCRNEGIQNQRTKDKLALEKIKGRQKVELEVSVFKAIFSHQ